jgi:mannose-6-phosphate isomerase-like protein (cupin superfamily)
MARVVERTEWAIHPTRAHGEWEGGDANVTIIFHDSIEAGHGPRLHTHPYPETFVIEAGRARFTVGDEVVEAGPGQILVVPAETPHKFETLGPMRSIHIHASPRFVTKWLE